MHFSTGTYHWYQKMKISVSSLEQEGYMRNFVLTVSDLYSFFYMSGAQHPSNWKTLHLFRCSESSISSRCELNLSSVCNPFSVSKIHLLSGMLSLNPVWLITHSLSFLSICDSDIINFYQHLMHANLKVQNFKTWYNMR